MALPLLQCPDSESHCDPVSHSSPPQWANSVEVSLEIHFGLREDLERQVIIHHV